VRGFDYYTGVRFQAFVPGVSHAVLGGGRYDDLLARYGRPSPAVGFAIDVEAAAGALEAVDGGVRAANGAAAESSSAPHSPGSTCAASPCRRTSGSSETSSARSTPGS
jgi:ATP phosphoribosyltransferase regulatory subunit